MVVPWRPEPWHPLAALLDAGLLDAEAVHAVLLDAAGLDAAPPAVAGLWDAAQLPLLWLPPQASRRPAPCIWEST